MFMFTTAFDATKLCNAPKHAMDGPSDNRDQYRSQVLVQLPRDFPRHLTPFPQDSRNIKPVPAKPAVV